jgi:nucleoside-diphosphate-sugar epimerase
MAGKKILVTGATGFVGRSLCSLLVELGYIVIPTARVQPSDQSGWDYFVTGNISESTDWLHGLVDVDVVIHLAARAHVIDDHVANPLAEYRRQNTTPTMKLGRDALESGVRRFIFISSVGVNGAETFGKPFRSGDVALPHSPYAISKYEAELGLRSLFQGTGTELVVVRPPLIYGLDAPGNFALIVKLLEKGVPIPLGGISNKRSFIALDNFIDLLEICISHPEAANKTLLVSDGVNLSTSDFVMLIGRLVAKNVFLFPVSPMIMRFVLETIGKRKIAQSLYGDLEMYSQETFDLLDWTPVFSPLSVLSNK